VGANVGEYTTDLLALGARVVAVEPQGACLERLRAKFQNDPRVVIVPSAVGPTRGTATLYTTDATAIGSCSREWVDAMRASGRFGKHDWGATIEVPMTTLDALVEEHGMPSFCKIDVEGFEPDVLRGMTRPIGMLSFEFTPETLWRTRDCVDHLSRLGPYRFNFAVHDQFAFHLSAWPTRDEFHNRLRHLPDPAVKWGGDVYARLDA
jgi:FkbM family methyltransferase